jgi:integrase
MPRLVNATPSYRLHKASGQAVVCLDGETIYLGAHGTKPSRAEYDRLIGEWLARGRRPATADDHRRVADVIIAYWDHARVYYAASRGERDCVKSALGVLRRCYGGTPAREFGPLGLQLVRDRMVAEDWSRTHVNAQFARLRRCFKWAAARELVPPGVFHGLQAVAGLRFGKGVARETEPVRPVPQERVERTLPFLSRPVAGLVRLQLATGMRPGEAVIVRGCDLDMTGDVWAYRPSKHKTQHRGHERVIHLGPQARAVIEPFLTPDVQAFLFSPLDAEHDRHERLRAARRTPLSCGNRPGSNVCASPRRRPSGRYSVGTYRQAIERACDAAFPPPGDLARQRVARTDGKRGERRETVAEWRSRLGGRWPEVLKWRDAHRWHPHQLRHSAATRLRKSHGLEAARLVLGQKSGAVAEVYAEVDQTKAEKIMAEVG